MPKVLTLRPLTEDETRIIDRLAHSRTESARAMERAQIIWQARSGARVPAIARALGVCEATVRLWLTRFNAAGVAGLRDGARAGRPPTYSPEEVGEVIAASLTKPDDLGLPFGSWTLDRLTAYLQEQKGLAIGRTRIGEILREEGLRWRAQETWFGERPDPTGERRVRAKQEIDYGRHGTGYVFGAFRLATGAAFAAPYTGRTIANWVDFLERVDDWGDAEVTRVYAVLDNLSTHRAMDVLLWALEHPRWEFVFQPTYAAYLNLIEPWWKVLRSLALKGRRFATWDEVTAAVAAATQYWNAHRHPFVWGCRKRRRAARRAGLAQMPLAA